LVQIQSWILKNTLSLSQCTWSSWTSPTWESSEAV
jgi:hypothetical protein